MRKKKRTYTRRQRAALWFFRLAGLLLVCILLEVIRVLPSQTIGSVKQEHGLGEMEIVASGWGEHRPMNTKMVYLLEDEDQLLLTGAAFYFPYGWLDYGPGLIMQKNDPKEACSVWTVEHDEDIWVCLAGFVPEGGEAPVFTMGVSKWERDENDAYIFTGDSWTEQPIATIPARGGKCFMEFYHFRQSEDDMGVLVLAEIDGEWDEPAVRCSTFRLH